MLHKQIRHLAALVGIDFHVFDIQLKEFEAYEKTFCSKCPNPCDHRKIHLYGCYESIRWDNRYIYYCPMDFIFIALPVFDEFKLFNRGVIAGPILMGDISDFEQTYSLPWMDTTRVNDLAEISSAVFSRETNEKKTMSTADILNTIYKELEVLPQRANYSIDLEKKLQAAIVAGDDVGAKEYLNRLLGEIFFHSNGDFEVIKARALELLVLFSRSAIEGGADAQQILPLNNYYIHEINRFDTIEKLSLWLSSIINRFISYVFEFGDIKHGVILRKVIGYIRNNYMNKITLDDIAEHVSLSKSHISKIFNEEMNTNISSFVNEVRIEKSKHLLLDASNSIAQVANLTGFDDQSYFTKQFKMATGVSPKKFREKHGLL